MDFGNLSSATEKTELAKFLLQMIGLILRAKAMLFSFFVEEYILNLIKERG
jgi:hypothetical protein